MSAYHTPSAPKQIRPNWEPMQRSLLRRRAVTKGPETRNVRGRGAAIVAVNPREKCEAGERPQDQVRPKSNFLLANQPVLIISSIEIIGHGDSIRGEDRGGAVVFS